MLKQKLIPGFLSIGLLLFVAWNYIVPDSNIASEKNSKIAIQDKQRGAHVFGIVDSTDLNPLKENNIEWITLVSWGFQDDVHDSYVSHHDGDSLNIQRHNDHWIKRIKQVRKAGFKVFFKPHLWIQNSDDGKWRSDIDHKSVEDWEQWKTSYTNFILRYASVAEKSGAEMYCIGIEFTQLAIDKPDFWIDLIKQVRRVYSGKLVYAANWYKEYEKVTFWKELDFIGIQAYFPLTKKEYPSIKELGKGWNKHLPSLKTTFDSFNRPIIFTEIGYRSIANGAIKPWEWIENTPKDDTLFSPETQANCYQAFFNNIWSQDWFAGVHFWQMRTDYTDRHTEYIKLDFTPQGKPAEQILSKGYQ